MQPHKIWVNNKAYFGNHFDDVHSGFPQDGRVDKLVLGVLGLARAGRHRSPESGHRHFPESFNGANGLSNFNTFFSFKRIPEK